MDIYAEWLVPRLLDLVMRQKEIMPFRDRIGKAAAGRVLDVGIGSGVNLPHYGAGVSICAALPPCHATVAHRCGRACNAPVPVEFDCSSAEALLLDSKSIGGIALTFTLCTIGDPRAALVEMRRVA